jgi:hypothetical protein
MSGICDTNSRDEKFIENLVENPEGKRILGMSLIYIYIYIYI